MQGKFIVIDGIDGSGKATQVMLLAEKLKKAGQKVKTIDFPRYQGNFFGAFIGQCLAGKHGSFLKLDPYIASVLYAADRFESSDQIRKWLKQGYIVLADRYVSANQIHQGAKITTEKERIIFLAWLEKMEYEIFQLPRPDQIIFLDVSLPASSRLIEKNNKLHKNHFLPSKKDEYEKSPTHQAKARKSAISQVRRNNQWIRVDCMKNGRLMTKKEISDIIWDKLEKVIRK